MYAESAFFGSFLSFFLRFFFLPSSLDEPPSAFLAFLAFGLSGLSSSAALLPSASLPSSSSSRFFFFFLKALRPETGGPKQNV